MILTGLLLLLLTKIILPEKLYSVERRSGMLSGAMKALQTLGFSETEVLRLYHYPSCHRVPGKVCRYLDYGGIEKRLVELH